MASIDLKELESEIHRTRARFEAWASNKQQIALELKDSHLHRMKDQTEKVQQLHTRYKQEQRAAQQVKQRVEKEEQDVSTLQGTTEALQVERDALKRQLSKLQKAVEQQETELVRLKTGISADENAKRKKLAALKKGLALYSSRLGLEFKHGADELHLLFKQVDEANPSKEFLLGVRIQLDNTYQVTKCEPIFASLPELVQQLNRSNDFAAFIKASREEFVKLAAGT